MSTRVAILSYSRNQYSETFIRNMVERLPADVHLLYGGELPHFYGEEQKFLDLDGFGKVSVAIKEWLGTPAYQQHKEKIELYFLKHRIQAVIANYSITAFPVMDICEKHKIPLIVHFHGWTAYRATLLEQHAAEYIEMFRIAKAVIGVSKDMIEQLKRLGCPAEKLHLVTYGPNPDIFKYSDHSNNPNTFLSAGRFCDTKNPHLTVLAFSKVVAQLPGAKLLMIGGDENLMNATVNMAKALKVLDRIEFCGVLKPEEVYEKMRSSIAFVQHSATTILNEKEGTPVAILEASASGLPVVATRHAGIKDVVIENETGLLCDEFDVDTMAANMIKVATDKTLARSLGLKASERINQHFTMEQYIGGLNKVLQSVVK